MTYESISPSVGASVLYTALFEALPGNSILVQADAPRFTVLAATPGYLHNSGHTKKTLIGKGVFEAFPANNADPNHKGDKDLFFSFQYVLQHKEPHFLPLQRYDLPNGDGSFTEKYWRASNTPVFTPDGNVAYIIHTAEDITEQIKAEKREEVHVELQKAFHKAEESEAAMQQFKFMADNAQDPFILMREDGTFAYLNQKALETWGYTEEEAKHIRVPDVDPIYQEEAFARAQNGEILKFETLHKRKDGVVYPVEVNMNGITLNDIPYLFAVARDITEHKKAEELLRKSEQRQTFLLRLNDLLRALADPKAIQYEAAGLVAKHFGAGRAGYAEDTGDGKTVAVTVDYTNGGPSLKGVYNYDDYSVELLQAFREGRTIVRNDIMNDPALSPAEKEANATLGLGATVNIPLLKNDALIAVFFMHYREAHQWTEEEVSLLQEVAERTWEAVVRARAEQALRESEERFRVMADSVPISIWITDKEGRIEFLNKHWWDYCGEPAFETTPDSIAAKHIHPEDGPKVMQAFGKALLTGEHFEVEQRNRSWNGEYRWFLNRANPHKDPITGEIIKWFGVGVDIYDRKLAEQALRLSEETLEKKVQERTLELERANEELKRSNQNLEEFAHAASHDLKEPIRKIHFFTNQLKVQLSTHLNEAEIRSFNRIENATERMGNLIDDLLLYSHVSQRPHEKENVDLAQNVQRVLEDLELDIEEKMAVIRVAKLPTVKGYRRQLQQLFQNLISNALKYTRADVSAIIDVTASEVTENGRRYYLIAVKDNGIGFEPEYADKIFQMFTRLHGKNEYSGTGVGLSIVKKVVENHNGFIRVESIPGEGSTFSVYLPAE